MIHGEGDIFYLYVPVFIGAVSYATEDKIFCDFIIKSSVTTEVNRHE